MDWLFDSINLDPMILVKYVNTTHQVADILTKGSFTRDRRTHQTRLVDIMTHSTSDQSNLPVFSAVVISFFQHE